MAVYEPVSGSLSLNPLDSKGRPPTCVVAVSDTEIVAIDSVEDFDDPCSQNITVYSIHNGTSRELPCIPRSKNGDMNADIGCAGADNNLYVLDQQTNKVFRLDLTSLQWQFFSIRTDQWDLPGNSFRSTQMVGVAEGDLFLHHLHKDSEDHALKVFMTRLDAEGKAFSGLATKQPFKSVQAVLT